ncbi:hypothetical protein SAMN05216553_10526 [Lentzea fradiae]|uniref:Uncharacterized protein n=1 Tax=Lentzea fradiae TaxID=200378 RepID=A0A1G7QZY4_9PSEU|nr:hypothetical protein [Lentzea fradiae]SDG04047.1 hypothetical protein SAMN05216553_10526 [Lentzea fradiae]
MAIKVIFTLMTAALVGLWVLLGRVTGDWWDGGNPMMYFAIGIAVVGVVFGLVDWGDTDERRAKSFADLPLAVGVVVSVRATGLTVNDEPHVVVGLDVLTPDGDRFRAQARHVVRRNEIGTLTAGTRLPVHHRPGATDGFVTIAASLDDVAAQELSQRVDLAAGWLTEAQWHVLAHGTAFEAVVMRVEPTGVVDDGATEMDLALSFDETVVRQHIPQRALAAVQVGAVVTVRHLPGAQPTSVIVVPHGLRVPAMTW